MKPWIVFLIVGLVPAIVHASDSEVIAVGQFSAVSPGEQVSGWEPLIFNKIEAHTRYALIRDDDRTVLRAYSQASASGFVKNMSIGPNDYPVLTWQWKVSNIIASGDVTKKSGDDYPARIYITFAEDPENLSFLQRTAMAAVKAIYGKPVPTAALAYIWGNRAEVGSIHPNPYTGRLQMIVVESGPTHLNQWRSARRHIVDDFRQSQV